MEDGTATPGDYSFTIKTDDESQGGVTYTVEFGVGTDAATATYNMVYDTTHGGYVPNLGIVDALDTGKISFDPTTKIVTWHTSNADVNWDGANYENSAQKGTSSTLQLRTTLRWGARPRTTSSRLKFRK